MNLNKAVCFTNWSPGHNNARHAELFPRLRSVVHFSKIVYSRHRYLRGAQYRLWHLLKRRVIYPSALGRLRKRFNSLFTIDCQQIPFWTNSVVVDMDDPIYSAAEVSLLNLPQVKAIVVTTERARQIFEDLGVRRPIHVIPQGVSVHKRDGANQLSHQLKGASGIVVGYIAPVLTLAGDNPRTGRRGEYALDFLLAAVEHAVRVQPRIQLWLLGQPSSSLIDYAKTAGDWVKLMGYVPLSQISEFVSAFDIGVYPRVAGVLPPGRFNLKLAQYMACGVPIVSTDADESSVVRDAGSGTVCRSQEAFSRALVDLASSPQERMRLGESGRQYASAYLEWSHIIPKYEQIIRDAQA